MSQISNSNPMTRGKKILIIVLSCIFAVFVAAFICADVLISRAVHQKVNEALVNLPNCEAGCGDIHVYFFGGMAEVKDLYFRYTADEELVKQSIGKKQAAKLKQMPGIEVRIESVSVGRVFYGPLLSKNLLLHAIHIDHPSVELWLDEKHPELAFPQMRDTTLEKANMWLKEAVLNRFHIDDASLAYHSLREKTDIGVKALSLCVHDLAFNFVDTTFSYNDSVYSLDLDEFAVVVPDGLTRIEAHDIKTHNQKGLELGYTRIANTMPKNKMADIVKEPVTWMDLQIKSVKTSPFNPIRKALAKDYTLDNMDVVIEQMDVYRDNRYKPTKPFPMPQEILMALPVKFNIKQVNAKMKKINIELVLTSDKNVGQLTISDIKAKVKNVTNRKDQVMSIEGDCPFGTTGHAEAQVSMQMSKNSQFQTRLHAEKVQLNTLNPFLRPMLGITCDCNLDALDTHYTGDNVQATGTFRMLYQGLYVRVHEEDDIPIKALKDHAKFITSAANSLLPKSNPTSVDVRPRAYSVNWKRDEWKPFPLYLFGPMIDGIKKTMLPGLFVHEQTKNDDFSK